MKKIQIINGPNLNLLSIRETSIYGSKTLKSIEDCLAKTYADTTVLHFFQSQSECKIIEKIHAAYLSEKMDGIVINAGAFTHTSIAIRDALIAVNIPFIEVHLSNVYKREAFRKHSYLSDHALGVITGFKDLVYDLAIQAMNRHLNSTENK